MTCISTIKTSEQAFVSLPSVNLCNSVKAFAKFNDTLHNLYEEVNSQNYSRTSHVKVSSAEVMRELRSLVSIAELREAGSFFTGDSLANEAVSKFIKPITPSSIVLDPTCGAGNLLIACSKKLPIKTTLKNTLKLWGSVLTGFDVFPEFVEATKLRLILEAFQRGAIPNGDTIDELKDLFPAGVCAVPGVLVQLVAWLPQRPGIFPGPGPRPGRGVFNCKPVQHRAIVHPIEPLGHLQLFRRSPEPRLVVEIRRLDDEGIALPAGNRVAEPLAQAVGPVGVLERDDPDVVDHLGEDHHVVLGLHHLLHVVIEVGRQHRGTR